MTHRRLLNIALAASALFAVVPAASAQPIAGTAQPTETLMNSQDNLRLAQRFLEKLGSGASPDEIAALCTTDLDWNIPGDSGVLPWVGHKTGNVAMAEFVRDTQTMIKRESLEIQDILASGERVVVLGHLKTRITATGRLIDGAFAIVLTFNGDRIASFLMLEDSFATSKAARR
jgi:ketosteroid isomerase-like protein